MIRSTILKFRQWIIITILFVEQLHCLTRCVVKCMVYKSEILKINKCYFFSKIIEMSNSLKTQSIRSHHNSSTKYHCNICITKVINCVPFNVCKRSPNSYHLINGFFWFPLVFYYYKFP